MDKRVLVLVDNNDNGFFPQATKNSRIMELYVSNNKVNRIVRKIALKYSLPIRRLFFSEWYKEEDKYDLIILFDTGNAKYIIPLLQKKHPKARIILWFWNSVCKTIDPTEIKQPNVELWSFDPADCKKYAMRQNTQFFPYEKYKDIKIDTKRQFDVFFVGTSKGRIETLRELKAELIQNNLTYKFHIVGDVTKRIGELDCAYCHSMKYSDVIVNDLRSRAIIDIASEGQHGLTLRPLEAIFLKRKLITNFRDIKKYPFFNMKNIYVLGDRRKETIAEFLSIEYDDSFDPMYFDMDSWIERFLTKS